jgi:hypothetical protein
MGYATPLPGEAAAAGAARVALKVTCRAVDAAPAVERQRDAAFRDRSKGAALGAARQATFVVAHPEHGADQNGCRNADKPHSNENQPECHALPVFAYRELYRMLHQSQDTTGVSSRTVRRNPATRGGGMTPPARFGSLCRESGRAVLLLSVPRQAQQVHGPGLDNSPLLGYFCTRNILGPPLAPLEARDVVPLTCRKGAPASAKRHSPRRFEASVSHLPRITPVAGLSLARPGCHEYSPVKISTSRSLAISRSLLNAWSRGADAVPNDPARGLA